MKLELISVIKVCLENFCEIRPATFGVHRICNIDLITIKESY